jgi:multimeric flavodoxin WrbA
MKILGIVGSPRKEGNTEIMMEEALAAAREAGAETELVHVAGKDIAPCDACATCRQTGKCRIKDDMQPIYEQLEAADGILFGTPVYFGGYTAQAKAIMDRMYVYLGDRKLQGKVAGPIVVTRRVGAIQTRNLINGFLIAQGMIVVRGAIGYGREKGEVREGVGGGHGNTALGEARTVAKDVVEMVELLQKARA